MNRRRMMMLQQNKGFELVYDATSGKLPQANDGWDLTLNGNTTATVKNGYLRIAGDGSHLNPRFKLTLNKKQNLNKSRSVTVKIGDVTNTTIDFSITDTKYFLERYPRGTILIYKTWGQNYIQIQNDDSVGYQTVSIVYDAQTRVTSFYRNDKLLFASEEPIPKDFLLSISGAGYFEVSNITYKEW